MAYKSRVTNKYMGASFAGQVNAADSSEALNLVRVLQRDINPALQEIFKTEINKQQDTAKSKINELYASGKSSEDINQEILQGKHPELSGTYVNKIVSQERGKLAAFDAIAKINENIGKYDFRTTNLPAFYKEYLPSFADKDGAFALGFSSVFNEYKAKEAIKDGLVRNEEAQKIKIENGAKMLSRETADNYWNAVNALVIKVPPEEGKTGVRYIRTYEEANKSAMLHLSTAIKTASTTAELQVIEDIIKKDRGIGVGGNKLGSLYDNRNKLENAELIRSLEDKQRTLSNYEYTQASKARELDKQKTLKDLFSIDRSTAEGELKFMDLAKQAVKKYPSIAVTINTAAKSQAELFEDSGAISLLKADIMRGVYNNKPKALEEAWRNASNNWSTYDKLMSLQMDAQLREANNYVSPFQEREFIKVTKDITDFMTNAVSSYSKKYEGQQNAFISKLINKQIGDEYIWWLGKYPKPSKTADSTTKNQWENDHRLFFEDLYNKKIKQWNTSAYLQGLGALIDKSSSGLTTSTNLNDLGIQFLETSAKTSAQKFQPFVSKIKSEADLNLIDPVQIIMESNDFKRLIKTEAGLKDLQKDKEKQRAYATRIANELGMSSIDYTDEIINLLDNINLNLQEFQLPPIETYTPLGLVEKGSSVQNQQNFFINALESISGRPMTKDIYNKILDDASKEVLAQAFNINTMQLDKLVNKYLK